MSKKSFHVKQDIVLHPQNGQPSGAEEGQIYYDGVIKKYFSYQNGAWKKVGAGAGTVNYIDNGDAEDGVLTPFYEYANTPGPQPVNGQGGSPVPLLTINSSGPLAGAKDFLYSKDAANRQGQGFAVPFTVDNYIASSLAPIQLSVQYKTSGAFVTGPSSDLTIWIYDTANNTLITVRQPNIIGASGQFLTSFQPVHTTATAYLLIGHISTVNASAWTFEFDNVVASPVLNIPINVKSDTLWAGFHDGSYSWTRNGGMGDFGINGTGIFTETKNNDFGAVVTAAGTLPGITFTPRASGITYKITAKYSTYCISNGTQGQQRLWDGTTVIDSSTGQINANPVNTQGGNIGTSQVLEGLYTSLNTSPVTITIQGWTSGGTTFLEAIGTGNAISWIVEQVTPDQSIFQPSSKISASQLIVQGTRVSVVPTQIGQYRTFQKNSSSSSGTDTAPATAPTLADGMAIGAFNFATAGSGPFNISRWDIFIGFNKSYRINGYTGAGKTGRLTTDFFEEGNSFAGGFEVAYNPTEGVLTVTVIRGSSGNTNNAVGQGIDINGGAQSDLGNGYFDVEISDNPIGIGFGQSRIVRSLTTGPSFAFSGGTPVAVPDFGGINPITATVACDGGDVMVGLMGDSTGNIASVFSDSTPTDSHAEIFFYRDGVQIGSGQMYMQNNISIEIMGIPCSAFWFYDTPSPGIHTYTVFVSGGPNRGDQSISNTILYARPMA